MNSKKFNVLTSFWFLTCLCILLLNDFFLKKIFHNWITGKLSDFVGLFVFSIFFSCFLKERKWIVYILTAILFIYWKSSFSSEIIDFWNTLKIFPIQRIVDYTDLIALSILPSAYYYQKQAFKKLGRPFFKYAVIIICVFAFMATSRPDDEINDSILLDKTYILTLDKETLISRLETLETIEFVEDFTNRNNEYFGIIFLEKNTCVGNFEYRLILTEQSNNATELYLSSVFYSCQGQDLTTEELIALFEEEVIAKIS